MKEEVLNSVHELRQDAKVTQEQFAEKIGVTRQTVIAIEKGNYIPSLLLAMKISEFFEKKIEEIFTLNKNHEK